MENDTEPDQAAGSASSAGRSDEPGRSEASQPDEPGLPAGGETLAVSGTGGPRVDAALRLLDRLPGLPVSEHPELFEQVHAQLTEVLGELDSPQASSQAS
jgi:hypothetical protein